MASVAKFIRNNRAAQYADVACAFVLLAISYYTKSSDSLFLAGVAAILLSGRIITIALLEEKIFPLQHQVEKLGSIIDLSPDNNVSDLKTLFDTFNGITDEEFASVKYTILSEATEKLRLISVRKTSGELGRGEYYQWLLPILLKVEANQLICAVSIMADAEWDNSAEEDKFFDGNLSAAKRGARVERIFIVKDEQRSRFVELPQVRAHFVHSEPRNLIGYVIAYEEIKRRDASLLEAAGHGFIDFDGRVALIDNFSESGEVRGFVTKNAAELKRLRDTFSKLRNMARELSPSVNMGAGIQIAPQPPSQKVLPSSPN